MEKDSGTSPSNSSSNRQNVSFKFTKTAPKTLIGNSLDEKTANLKDYVSSVDDTKICSIVKVDDPKNLVIPLIKKNKWRTSSVAEKKSIDKESQINELAVQELLKEASEKNEAWENRESKDLIDFIPLIMQNKVPQGYETDDKLDLSLRPEESTLEDYDKVPIEQFGLAMLRGMGWKEGDSIGDKNKGCVKPVEVQLRPKGLGLGADASVLKKSQKKAKEEKLELVTGAYIQMTQGPLKGFYGQVLSLDMENARAIVKLSNEDQTRSFPEFFFNLVSKSEYDKESRIINRKAYETYKEKKEQKHKEEANGHDRREKRKYEDEYRESRLERRNSSERESKKNRKHSKHRKHSRERSEEKQSTSKSSHGRIWVRPQLKVRFIDDKYQNGKYFNKKLIVIDVLSHKCCSCKTEDHRTFLDDISPSMLETVIPRDESAYVMIVQGKYSGELCTILKKDKSQCVATVQFLSDRNHALKIEYDSICEYVGDVTQFD